MKRLVLRKGFSFQRTPEGAAHLVDGRTGDALLVPPADVAAVTALAKEGLDPEATSTAALLTKYAPFLIPGTPSDQSFYELDIADAPTMPAIPSVAPVTKTTPAVAPRVPSFHELAAVPAPATETWSVRNVAPAAAPPPPSAAPGSLHTDDWAVATNVEPVEGAVRSGSHVAEAVSPMLSPNLDDLVPPRDPNAEGARVSGDSPPPVATQPSPVPQIPAVRPSPAAPVTSQPSPAPQIPAVRPSPGAPGASLAPRPSPVPAIAPVTLPDVPKVQPSFELEPLPEPASTDARKAQPSFEIEPLPEAAEATVTEVPLLELEPLPEEPNTVTTSEQELRQALAAKDAQPEEPLVGEALPLDEPAPGPEQFRSQEENLRAALDEKAPQSRADVQAMLTDTAKNFAAPPPAEPEPAALPSSKKPMILTFVGVLLLALGVAASFTLRPDGEKQTPDPTPTPKAPVAAVVDAGAQAPVAVVEPLQPAVVVDAGAAEVAMVDAGTPEPVVDVEPTTDIKPTADDAVSAEISARGRVKMGEVLAGADGTLTWTAEPEQRVKSKQALGSLARGDGSQAALTSPAVGLAMFKKQSGEAVKKGAVLAEVIYFEAWAKAQVKDAKPTPAWRCEVVSEAAKQRAPCKISVVTPKGSGAQVTVAIEPRWFDSATDAVLKLSP